MTAQCTQAWWQSPVRRRRLGSITPALQASCSMQRGCFCSGMPCLCHQPWGLHAGALDWSGGLLCSGSTAAGPMASGSHVTACAQKPLSSGDTLRPGSARPLALPHWRLLAPAAAPWIRTCIRSPLLSFAVCCVLGGGGRLAPSPHPPFWHSARPPEPARRAARQVEGAHACVCAHGAVCGVGLVPYRGLVPHAALRAHGRWARAPSLPG